jgi:hypothetical protein
MPCVSEFYGISIYMYYNDHEPRHFHALHAEDEVVIGIDALEVLRGRLRRRALALVLEWAAEHQPELDENWELAREGLPLNEIEGLE